MSLWVFDLFQISAGFIFFDFFRRKGLKLPVFFDWDLGGNSRKDGNAMMTVEEMKAVDIRTVDRDTLVDICDVKIDRSLPLEERVRSFVEQIKNPYCFKCGNAVVKTSFLDTDVTLEECVESYLRNL